VPNRLDQEADIVLVDAGDGVAEADGCLIGEAGREAEHSALSARAWQTAGVERTDRGFPVDAGQFGAGAADAGADVDEAGEVVAGEPGWAMISPVAASSV
jgi:hypothetical protein